VKKGRAPLWARGPFLILLLLAACNGRSTPTAEENRQLNNAAQMLDAAPNMLGNIDENGLGPAEDNSVNRAASER
jgi:hypothetical protein